MLGPRNSVLMALLRGSYQIFEFAMNGTV